MNQFNQLFAEVVSSEEDREAAMGLLADCAYEIVSEIAQASPPKAKTSI